MIIKELLQRGDVLLRFLDKTRRDRVPRHRNRQFDPFRVLFTYVR